ncbi:hypothetical protein Mgra_00007867 [Meloidogyne graminicola]|uniref:Uncharacterized protein n=1 Tax=Meloidogyne graminicola TaxID=189291 RepID=A0A8S9ZHC9_9BILA|nr:hypothetical protein Mgra_00007867 [Meloidogyne graminicola]
MDGLKSAKMTEVTCSSSHPNLKFSAPNKSFSNYYSIFYTHFLSLFSTFLFFFFFHQGK